MKNLREGLRVVAEPHLALLYFARRSRLVPSPYLFTTQTEGDERLGRNDAMVKVAGYLGKDEDWRKGKPSLDTARYHQILLRGTTGNEFVVEAKHDPFWTCLITLLTYLLQVDYKTVDQRHQRKCSGFLPRPLADYLASLLPRQVTWPYLTTALTPVWSASLTDIRQRLINKHRSSCGETRILNLLTFKLEVKLQ